VHDILCKPWVYQPESSITVTFVHLTRGVTRKLLAVVRATSRFYFKETRGEGERLLRERLEATLESEREREREKERERARARARALAHANKSVCERLEISNNLPQPHKPWYSKRVLSLCAAFRMWVRHRSGLSGDFHPPGDSAREKLRRILLRSRVDSVSAVPHPAAAEGELMKHKSTFWKYMMGERDENCVKAWGKLFQVEGAEY